MSITVTVIVHGAVLLYASVAVNTTVEEPTGNKEPLARPEDCVTVTSAAQLATDTAENVIVSVQHDDEADSVTLGWHTRLARRGLPTGSTSEHCILGGGVVEGVVRTVHGSTTTANEHEAVLEALSVAAKVTVVVPQERGSHWPIPRFVPWLSRQRCSCQSLMVR